MQALELNTKSKIKQLEAGHWAFFIVDTTYSFIIMKRLLRAGQPFTWYHFALITIRVMTCTFSITYHEIFDWVIYQKSPSLFTKDYSDRLGIAFQNGATFIQGCAKFLSIYNLVNQNKVDIVNVAVNASVMAVIGMIAHSYATGRENYKMVSMRTLVGFIISNTVFQIYSIYTLFDNWLTQLSVSAVSLTLAASASILPQQLLKTGNLDYHILQEVALLPFVTLDFVFFMLITERYIVK